VPAIRASQPELIDPSVPWDFFDGASQNLLCGGGGGVLHISESHSFKIKMGLGKGTNNYVELMALLLLLKFSIEQGIHTIQLFGDSMNVINWVQKIQSCHNILLQPIMEEISTLLVSFDTFVIRHVYRNKNSIADALSKEGISLPYGHWHFSESNGDTTQNFFHRPFIEDPAQA
jgi:ribonuclease HI